MSDPKSYKSLFAAIFAIVFTISGYSIEFLVTKVPLNDYLVSKTDTKYFETNFCF